MHECTILFILFIIIQSNKITSHIIRYIEQNWFNENKSECSAEN